MFECFDRHSLVAAKGGGHKKDKWADRLLDVALRVSPAFRKVWRAAAVMPVRRAYVASVDVPAKPHALDERTSSRKALTSAEIWDAGLARRSALAGGALAGPT